MLLYRNELVVKGEIKMEDNNVEECKKVPIVFITIAIIFIIAFFIILVLPLIKKIVVVI